MIPANQRFRRGGRKKPKPLLKGKQQFRNPLHPNLETGFEDEERRSAYPAF
jgi:hypothetical protein